MTDASAREALQPSELRFATIFERSPLPQAILTADDARYVEVNDRLLAMAGLAREEVIGHRAEELVRWLVPEDRARFVSELQRTGSNADFETTLVLKSGEQRHVALAASVLELDGRECFLWTISDLTHRKEAEDLKVQLEHFFNMSLDMLCIAGVDGYYRRLNPAFEALGYTTEELCSKPIVDFVHPDDVEPTMRELEKLGRGEDTVHFENRYRCKDGSYRWLHWRSRPDATGTIYSAARDVTESKLQAEANEQLTQKLLRSNKELEEFAMIASHDLQEPLRKIRMFADRLKSTAGDALGEEGADYLNRLQNAAVRGQSLIGGLLAYSRVTTKGQPPVDVDLAIVAKQVAIDLEAQVARVHGRIDVGPLPVIQADPVQMRQLFQNLLSNALKFHRAGSTPIVRVEAVRAQPRSQRSAKSDPREWWEITVSDNGIGFEPQYADRIFGLFQRLNGSSEFEGSGIGLAVCKKIVLRHGGTILARSNEGAGASFVVTLPRLMRS